jgi:prophage regulatory protein
MTDRLLRLKDVIGSKPHGIAAIIPVSRSTWLQGVKIGLYPQPVRLGVGCVAWRLSEVQALIGAVT